MHILIAPWLKMYIFLLKSSRKYQNSWREKNIIQTTLWKLKNLVFLFPSLTYCVSTARVRRQVKYTHIKNRYSVSLNGREATMSPAFEGITCNLTQRLSGRQQWGDSPVEWGAGLCCSVSADSQPEQQSARLGARQTSCSPASNDHTEIRQRQAQWESRSPWG